MQRFMSAHARPGLRDGRVATWVRIYVAEFRARVRGRCVLYDISWLGMEMRDCPPVCTCSRFQSQVYACISDANYTDGQSM